MCDDLLMRKKDVPLLTHPLALAAGLSALIGCTNEPQPQVGFVVIPPPDRSASAEPPPPPPPEKK